MLLTISRVHIFLKSDSVFPRSETFECRPTGILEQRCIRSIMSPDAEDVSNPKGVSGCFLCAKSQRVCGSGHVRQLIRIVIYISGDYRDSASIPRNVYDFCCSFHFLSIQLLLQQPILPTRTRIDIFHTMDSASSHQFSPSFPWTLWPKHNRYITASNMHKRVTIH
jgi:hypothetical protein